MRTYARILGIAATAAAITALGSPAFAGGGPDSVEQEFGIESESGHAGNGGDGGESANALSCLVNIPVISPNSDQVCNPSSDGGEAGDSTATSGQHGED